MLLKYPQNKHMKLHSALLVQTKANVLVFVDAKIKDYQCLKKSIKAGAEAFILHPEVDAIQQITDTLSQYSNVESIHIVSHGTPGTLYLGDNELNLDTLEHYCQQLKSWFNSVPSYLKPTLFIYGCNVAATGAGTEFLEKLHQITQATIYASSTPVGNSALGGNWNLDVCYGDKALKSPVLAFQPEVLTTYAGVFATETDGKYTYYDSKEGTKGTVAFTPIDGLNSGGTELTVTRDGQAPVILPFTFNFYGTFYNRIIVGENGGIAFVGSTGTAQFRSNNAEIPSTSASSAPVNSLFPFWDDLTGGKIHYKQDANRFIIQWSNFRSEDSGEIITFQLVLHKDSNNIDFVYLTPNTGATASIGLNKSQENNNPVGLRYSVDQPNLNGVTSIRFVTEAKLVSNNLLIKEGETVQLTRDNFNATNVDSADLSKITYKIINPVNGEFLLTGKSVTEFTQQDINEGKVQFKHNGGENPPSFDIELFDGFNITSSRSLNTTSGITFTNINDNPTLTGLTNSVFFKENSLNASADIIYKSSVTLEDVDSPDFNSGNLTISYSSGAAQQQDQLSIRNSSAITLTNGVVSFNGNVIGTADSVNNGRQGKSLVINFTSANATLAAVKALIESLTYQNTSDTPTTNRTITATVNDGDGATSTGVTTVINVTAENDAPANKLPQTQTIDEDNSIIFTGDKLISISDPDAGTNPVQVTLTASNGKLSLTGEKGLNFSDKDGTDGTLKFTGSILDVNNALNGMTFTPKADFNGANSITVITEDLNNSGAGINEVVENTLNITVNAVNDSPVNVFPSSVSIDEDTVLTFSGDKTISIRDVDVNEQGGTGEVQVSLSVTKGILNLDESKLGLLKFASGNTNANAAMTFSGKLADINSVLSSLTYKGNKDFNGEDTLTITSNDLGNYGKVPTEKKIETTTNAFKIMVNAVNDAPVNTLPSTVQEVNEDENLVFSKDKGNSITISDVDVTESSTGKLRVTLSVTKGLLNLKETTGLEFAPSNSNGSAQITFTGKVEDINKALEGLNYRGNKNYNGQDTLTITTDDLGNTGKSTQTTLSKTDNFNIKVIPVNDPPANTEVPDAQSINEDTNLVFSAANKNAITISDIDLDGENKFVDEAQVTLAVKNGKVNLTQTTGITLVPGNENSRATVIFTGKVKDINKALDGLTYQSNQDFNGVDSLTISVNDKSNGGTGVGGIGGELFAQNTVNINVRAINDSPVNTAPKTQSIKEDTDLIFSIANNNSISINDVDVKEDIGEIEVQLSVTKGLLTLQETTGLNFKGGDSKGKAIMTFTGKKKDINKALKNLTYRPDINVHGKETLTITTSDNGNSGDGGVLVTKDAIDITIDAVNDTPINSVPAQQEVDEDEKLVFNTKNGNAISISDVDVNEGTGDAEITLSVTKGTLTLGLTEGLAFKGGDGTADTTMTFIGKVADVNKAFDGMFYLGNKDFSGVETLSIITTDRGNFGDKSIQIDTDTIGITVIPDLDADGINNLTEEKVALLVAQQQVVDIKFRGLSQRATKEGGIVALLAGDGGIKQPVVIAIDDKEQKRLGGNSQNPAIVISNVETKRFKEVVSDAIAVFDSKDLKKSSLKKVTAAMDIIDFKVIPDSKLTDGNSQQKIIDDIKQKPVLLEIKLPDGPDDVAVNSIFLRKADGTLVDFRREVNPQRGQLDDDMLTGVVLQDRNFDGKADWAVTYLQDGQWGDVDGLANGEIQKSLVAVNWDLGTSRMSVRSNQDGLNFHGNRSYVQFALSGFSGEASEIGMARVRFGNEGQIIEVNGKAVNSLDEAKQTIIRRGETLFSSLRDKRNPDFGAQTRTIAFESGEQAVFFVIKDGTKDELLFNGLNSKAVQFSVSSLNEGVSIFQASAEDSGQTAKFSLAGLFDIGAKILTPEELKPQLEILAIDASHTKVNMTGELIDLKSSLAFENRQVMLKFSLQREAAHNNSAYLYRVDDANGSILDPLTGMLINPTTQLSDDKRQRYLELVTGERLVKNAQFEGSNFTTKELSLTVNGGEYYAPFLVSNGTLSSIGNDFSRILTSYIGISNNGVDYVRNLGNGVFGFEDIIGGGDRDYNDMILSVKQVQIMG
jgi:Domain of unknown function (DUF4347)/Cadherin-like/Domain of unknown function (DUF4114)